MAPDLNGGAAKGSAGADGAVTGDAGPKRSFGEVIAVGTRPAGGGQIALAEPPRPGEPTLRWMSRPSAPPSRATVGSWRRASGGMSAIDSVGT